MAPFELRELGVRPGFEQARGQVGIAGAGGVVQGGVAFKIAGEAVCASFEKAIHRFDLFVSHRDDQRGSAVGVADFEVRALVEQTMNPKCRAVFGGSMQGGIAELVNGVDVVSGRGHRE